MLTCLLTLNLASRLLASLVASFYTTNKKHFARTVLKILENVLAIYVATRCVLQHTCRIRKKGYSHKTNTTNHVKYQLETDLVNIVYKLVFTGITTTPSVLSIHTLPIWHQPISSIFLAGSSGHWQTTTRVAGCKYTARLLL